MLLYHDCTMLLYRGSWCVIVVYVMFRCPFAGDSPLLDGYPFGQTFTIKYAVMMVMIGGEGDDGGGDDDLHHVALVAMMMMIDGGDGGGAMVVMIDS